MKFYYIDKNRITKSQTWKLPTTLSEKLWKLIPKWILKKPFKKCALEVLAIQYVPGRVSFSSLRNVATIMNTFAITTKVKLIEINGQDNSTQLLKKILKKYENKEFKSLIIPRYKLIV